MNPLSALVSCPRSPPHSAVDEGDKQATENKERVSRFRPYWDAANFGIGTLAIGAIRLYQWTLRPLIGANCRFEPSCSEYAIGALRAHGPLKGTLLALWRILRCNPWSTGGYDPVPHRPLPHRPLPHRHDRRVHCPGETEV